MKANLEVHAVNDRARTGTARTPRGSFSTPCFMPVGTRGSVRLLDTVDLENLGAEVVLGNTYHLMLRPGADVVASLGGLHGFMDWSGQVLTDSGGYQVFSLEPDIDDDGATFRSVYDGSTHRLTPERAVDLQLDLGSDIQMVLDVCPGLPSPPDVLASAVDRTARWAERARARFLASEIGPDTRCQFGIVQGGSDEALRIESARRTLDIGFDGYAIGGLSVGEERGAMLAALHAATDLLPADQPRYFMGLGDPVGIIESVALGVDMFDCVLPTRLGRHGTLLTDAGRVNVTRAEFIRDDGPVDPGWPDSPANRWSRGYLRHLLQVDEPTGRRIATLHNVAWLLRFMDHIRDAISAGTLDALRADVSAVWGPG